MFKVPNVYVTILLLFGDNKAGGRGQSKWIKVAA